MDSREQVDGLVGLHKFTVYEGDVEWVEDDESGLLVPANPVVHESPVYKNMIVTAGKNLAMDRLFGLASAVAVGHVGVGTDSTAAAVGQTQLNPSVAGSVLILAADAGTSRTDQTVTIKATFGTAQANFNWNEAGLFNGTVNGTSTMFNRVVIGPFNKTSAVSIIYTTTVTQS